MSFPLLALVIAAAAGMTMAFQGALNGLLGREIGLVETTLAVHVIGGAVAALLLIVPVLNAGGLARLGQPPWYAYLGGFLSAGIIYGVARAMPVAGVANATTAIIVGQVLTACLIDHFGLFNYKPVDFTWLRVIGIVLLAAGGRLLLQKH